MDVAYLGHTCALETNAKDILISWLCTSYVTETTNHISAQPYGTKNTLPSVAAGPTLSPQTEWSKQAREDYKLEVFIA